MKLVKTKELIEMKKALSELLPILLLTSVLISCAELPKTAPREEVQKIRKLAVVTSLSGQGTDISHYGGLTQSPYAKAFGVLGILIGSAAEKVAVQSSLEAYSDSLTSGFTNYSPKRVFDETFSRLFVMEFETVNPIEVEKTIIDRYGKKEDVEKKQMKDYTFLRDQFGVDSVLAVDFLYGLEVHGKTLAASVITADITLTRISDNTVLVSKQVTSGTIGKTWHNVNDFLKNNAALYKSEFSKASEAIVYLTALQLGVNLGSTGKFYWQQEKEAEETK
jgi:hypothetical protein